MNYKDAALALLLPFAAGFVLLRLLDKRSPAPTMPAPPSAGPVIGGEPIQITQGPLVALPGHTYFAALEMNGSAAALANPTRISAEAARQGFRDLAVFTERPSNWPGTIRGDYYVRGTYVQAQQKELQRRTTVIFGSVIVLDAWVST